MLYTSSMYAKSRFSYTDLEEAVLNDAAGQTPDLRCNGMIPVGLGKSGKINQHTV